MKLRLQGTVAALTGIALLAGCSPKGPAAGDDAGAGTDVAAFMGSWKLQGSIVAPWFAGDGFSPEADPEISGTPVVLAEASSSGPAALSCASATYAVKMSGLDGLFEGNLTDPDIASAALGIRKDQVTTLTESCKSATGDLELNYHLIGRDTMLLGFSNMVYQFQRIKS